MLLVIDLVLMLEGVLVRVVSFLRWVEGGRVVEGVMMGDIVWV